MSLAKVATLLVCLTLGSASDFKGPTIVRSDDIQKWKKKNEISFLLLKDKDCSECDKLVEAWESLSEIFSGVVSFGIMEASEIKKAPVQLRTTKFPSVKVLHHESADVTDFDRAISVESITSHALSLLDKLVRSRFTKKGFIQKDSYVITLGDANFTQMVQNSKEPWLIEFFAPWCGHCKSLAPAWKEAAKILDGRMKLGAVDATVHTQLSSRFQLKGFPTIKFFPPGSVDLDNSALEYNGGRSAADIVAWAETKLQAFQPPPELIQLTSNSVLEQHCTSKSLCVIAFLPSRLDSSSADWNRYIDSLKEVMKTYKDSSWGWTWAEEGSQEPLESVVGVGGFGYPALVILKYSKKVYSPLKGPFTAAGIKDFLSSLNTKSVVTVSMHPIPELADVQPWDGSDFGAKTDL